MSLVLLVLVGAGALVTGWYFYQIGSRKKGRIRYKLRLAAVYLGVSFASLAILRSEGVRETEALILSFLAGAGSAFLVVKPYKQSRRIPKAVRDEVIARDLTSKGLKWDRDNDHIDHIVPHSRFGDNSARNLRVVDKQKNLRKGRKMPGLRDFVR
jgi:hypothetical protein